MLLWDAIVKENPNTHNIQVILTSNFPINEPLNPLGMTALHFAALNKKKEALETLLRYAKP